MKLKIRWIISLLLVCIFSVAFIGCSNNKESNQNSQEDSSESSGTLIPKLSFEEDFYATGVYEDLQLNVNSENVGRLRFKSADNDIAEVSTKGVVTGKRAGVTTISVSAIPLSGCVETRKITSKCTVNITEGSLIADLEDKTINWIGRNFEMKGEGVCCYNTSSGFELTFYGTKLEAKIKSGCDEIHTPQLLVLVDGSKDYSNENNIVDLAKEKRKTGTYTLVDNLIEDFHNVRVLKITEPKTTSVAFSSFMVDGFFATPPKNENIYNFDVYGDSITAGHLNMRTTRNELNSLEDKVQNGCMTYAYLASSDFNANLNVMARTSIGLLTTRGADCTLKDYWDKTYLAETDYLHDTPINPQWIFKDKKDAVIINIGTNDSHKASNGFPDTWDQEKFSKGLTDLCNKMLDVYGKKTKIILVYGIMENNRTKIGVTESFNQLKSQGIQNVYCKNLPASPLGHPIKEDNENAAKILLNLFKEIFN